MKTKFLALALATSVVIAYVPALQAQDDARWILRAGVHPVQPKPDNHPSLKVGDGAALTVGATHMLSRRWGLEVLVALPVEHDIQLESGGKVASVSQIPPTLSLQYYFLDPNGRTRAYIGAGLNYTMFFDEHTAGALAGETLELDPSIGPAAQLGLDMDIGRAWFIGIDARWFDIDTRATLSGTHLGTLEVDPYAFGLTVGRRLQ